MKRIWTTILAISIALAMFGAAGLPHAPAAGVVGRVRGLLGAADASASCAQIDKSLVQIDVPLSTTGQTPGRVFSKSDGAIAVLVIVESTTADGAASLIDFSASVKVSVVIARSAEASTALRLDPPMRSATNIGADGAALSGVSLCYRIAIPSPPAPVEPGKTPTTPTVLPSPTPIEFDVGPLQTANARAAATANAAASTAAAAQTAAAASASQVAQLQATSAAQASQIALMQSTISAPTPTSTVAPEGGRVVFSASTDQDFAQFVLPSAGWRVQQGLVSDGSSAGEWVLLPVIAGLSGDQAIEAEIQVGADGSCPRNFGLAVRGTENGFVAGGLEWACDAAVKLWAGQSMLAQGQAPALNGGWHVVRLETRGASVRLMVDGAVVLEAKTSQTAGSQLAIWSSGVSLSVRSVRVIDLS